MPFPTSYDSFDTSMQGTTFVSADDHANNHRVAGSALGTIEHVLGTTNGTQVLMNFAAGDFASRINAGGTLQQILAGTFNNGILGTPSITGGTANSQVLGTPTIQGTVVNTANIANLAVTAALLADAAASSRKIKFDRMGSALSASNNQTTTSTSFGNLSGGSVVITTDVASVLLILAQVSWLNNGVGNSASNLLSVQLNGNTLNGFTTGSPWIRYDSPLANNINTNFAFTTGTMGVGNGTIQLQWAVNAGTATINPYVHLLVIPIAS